MKINTEVRKFKCCICECVINTHSSSNSHKESPEMLRLFVSDVNCYFGLIKGDSGPEMIFTCSEKCNKILLSE